MKATLGAEPLVVAIGLMIGLCFAWTMRRVGARAVIRIRKLQDALQERYFRLLYLAAWLWIVLGFAISAATSSALIHCL